MDRGIYVAISGGVGFGRALEVITNNLAGSNVTGFKKDMPVFSLYQRGVIDNQVYPVMDISNERAYVNTGDIVTDFSQGVIKSTANPLDVAISGEGFFVVQTPEGRRYTRKGDFMLDKDGQLKTKDGYPVEGEGGVIQLTPGEVTISGDGMVSIDGNEIDRIKVVSFARPYPLKKLNSGLFTVKNKGVKALPAKSYSILQGHLEMSNVNAVKEMVTMISALRAYETHMKLVKGYDEITDEAIKLAST